MPEETIVAFQGHGRLEARLDTGLEDAERHFRRLYAAGVDYDDVVATLEQEGIEKFVGAVDDIVKEIADKRSQLVAAT